MKIIAKILIGLAVFANVNIVYATGLGHISDTLSTSAKGVGANHLIRFFNPSFIPAGGRIEFVPEIDRFNIPADFDFNDVDLLVSPSSEENFVQRDLADVPDAANDGVSAVSGAQGKVDITLNSTAGINAGYNVIIKLGTDAEHGTSGLRQILNPAEAGTRKIRVTTYNAIGHKIDSSEILVAITNPVIVTSFMPKIRANGKPSADDVLGAGTVVTLMSLTTNYRAFCRYIGTTDDSDDTASTTPYAAMPNAFTNSGDYYHSIFLTGLPFGHHRYYIRCMDRSSVADDTSYLIEFRIASSGEGDSGTGSGTGDEGTGSGTGSGGGTGDSTRPRGGGGGGSGGGTGPTQGPQTGDNQPYPPPLGPPNVSLIGWTSPNASVIILKDGKDEKKVTANASGEFKADYFELVRGVYTFTVKAEDTLKKLTSVHSSTVWVNDDTQTSIAEILLTPSITAAKISPSAGEKLELSGQTIPNSLTEITFFPETFSIPDPKRTITAFATSSLDGKWSAGIETAGLTQGRYTARARVMKTGIGYSNYSPNLAIGLGVSVDDNFLRADLNKDGKVNLMDFSILLYYWGKTNELADINADGTVSLMDFSIMMFQWTG